MSREWKPGMVGSIDTRGEDARVMFTGYHWVSASGELLNPHLVPRPLVVIDAEDREQVERFVRLIYPSAPSAIVDDFAGALREFASPTPPIEEPTEFAAMAVDVDGEVWHRVRDGEADGYPWATKDSKAKWQNLKIVRTFPAPEVTP